MPHSVHASPCSTSLSVKKYVDYWNENVPKTLWTAKCPDFLKNLTEKNVGILSTKDAEFKGQSWPEVQELVRTNNIHKFQRLPSDLRRYLKYTYDLKHSHGSVLSFIQHERLHWNSTEPSTDPPFTNPNDCKILYNDWPYGIDPNITHLVVWIKFVLEEDPNTGQLSREAESETEAFVVRTFCDQNRGGVSREQVVWFQNWRNLKSVHALDHFHVMLYKAPKKFLDEVTGGDVPMVKKNEGLT